MLYDLRLALRQLRRAPAFALFVMATLAIGIGANTTIFTVVNTLLLRPLPWQAAERMVTLSGSYVGRGDDWSVSLPNAEDWRTTNRSFDDVAYYQTSGVSLFDGGEPQRLTGLRSSANLFALLGVRPLFGRDFTVAEAAPAAERVAILGYALWQRQFGGDRGIIGRTISLSGSPVTIVGVMPEGFYFPAPNIELYTPLRASSTTWHRANGGLQVIGRLRAGITVEAAQRDMDAVSARLAAEHPVTNGELSAKLNPLRQAQYGGQDLSLILLLLLGAVGFVLLIACVNVANLLLARATSREREIAVRAAIGAARGRVLRQLLTESLLLAVLGGAFGMLLALWGTRAIAGIIPPGAGIARTFPINPLVLLFALGVTLLTAILFGIAPSLHASRTDLTALIGGRSGASSRRRGRRRNALVVAEVALASVLLVSAGLMLRSLGALMNHDAGFDPSDVLTMRVSLDARYTTTEQVNTFQRRVLEQMRARPGVLAAGAVDWIPLGGTNNFNDFYLEGGATDKPENTGSLIVTPGYMEAMRVRLLRGRTLQESDVREAPGVVVVSRSVAERYWPGEDALGQRLVLSFERGEKPYWRTVVGVVGDVRHGGMDSDPRAEMYIPYAQLPWTSNTMAFTIHTASAPAAFAESLRNAVWSVDAQLPVYDIRTMQRVVHESASVLLARVVAGALAIFAAIALLLAALGLYGVISYGVAQRTYEIGVRAALGADRASVLALVLRQGMTLVVLGLMLGLVGAYGVGKLLRGLLHEVGPTDPLAFGAMSAVLLLVAATATLLPARRAARIEPIVALRTE